MKSNLCRVFLFCFICLFVVPSLCAQNRYRVYKEICGRTFNPSFSGMISLSLAGEDIDLMKLCDERGNKIKINSMPEAMTYLSRWGWRLDSTSVAMYDKDMYVFFWVISKEVSSDAEILAGICGCVRPPKSK